MKNNFILILFLLIASACTPKKGSTIDDPFLGGGLGSFTMISVTTGINSATVTWNLSSGATSYDLFYDTSSHTDGSAYAQSSLGVTSGVSISGLTAGTTYYFRVKAHGASSTQLSTNELSGVPLQTLTLNIPFTAGTDASYNFDSNYVELTNGVVRLKAANQTDDDGSLQKFGAATAIMTGTQWDAGGFVRLNTTTNNSELDASWTPEWSHLVGYWKMNGTVGAIPNGSTIPATVGTNGTAVNASALSYVAGRMNQAMSFAPGQDVMKVNASLPITNKYTFSFWIYVNSFPATISAPISVTQAGVLEWEIFFNRNYVTGGYPVYGIDMADVASSKKSGTSANTFGISDLGSWHHIVFSYDSSATRKTKIYKDGNLLSAGFDEMDISFPTHDTFWVGGYRGDHNPCCNTDGKTEEVAVWDTALSQKEVSEIYNRQSAKYAGQFTSRVMDSLNGSASWTTTSATTTIPFFKELPGSAGSETSTDYSAINSGLMNNLVGLWHLNEASGATTALDSSGAANNGTASNTTFGTTAIFSSGASFNGTSSYISAPDAPSLNPTAITASAWIYPTALTTNWDTILAKTSTNSWTDGYGLSHFNSATDNKIYFWVNNYGSYRASVVVNLNQWQHVVGTYDGSNIKIYLNGKLASSVAYSGAMVASPNVLHIGSSSGAGGVAAYWWHGGLDEVAIWSRALSASEILQLYRRGANRLKYQVRSCANVDCSDQDALTSLGLGWKGPDNTQASYFSELQNNTAINSSGDPTGNVQVGPLGLQFSTFTLAGTGLSVSNNRYFQYRAIFESDDANSLCTYGSSAPCSPELKKVSIGPNHYDTSAHEITSKASIGSSYVTFDTNGFTETLGTSCSSGARYALSSDGVTFYYWNGSSWVVSSDYATASDAATVRSHINSFPTSAAGTGTIQVKTFLKSDGTSPCEVDNLLFTGAKN